MTRYGGHPDSSVPAIGTIVAIGRYIGHSSRDCLSARRLADVSSVNTHQRRADAQLMLVSGRCIEQTQREWGVRCDLSDASNTGSVGASARSQGGAQSIAFWHEAGLDYVSCSPFRVSVAHVATVASAETRDKCRRR
jgi:hypothetical protein